MNMDRYNFENDTDHIRLLELFTGICRGFEQPIYILIFSNFHVDIATEYELNQSLNNSILDNFIRINLHDIIRSISPDKDFAVKHMYQYELNEEETD